MDREIVNERGRGSRKTDKNKLGVRYRGSWRGSVSERDSGTEWDIWEEMLRQTEKWNRATDSTSTFACLLVEVWKRLQQRQAQTRIYMCFHCAKHFKTQTLQQQWTTIRQIELPYIWKGCCHKLCKAWLTWNMFLLTVWKPKHVYF